MTDRSLVCPNCYASYMLSEPYTAHIAHCGAPEQAMSKSQADIIWDDIASAFHWGDGRQDAFRRLEEALAKPTFTSEEIREALCGVHCTAHEAAVRRLVDLFLSKGLTIQKDE